MSLKRTIIFDIDGTLIDSFHAAGETYRASILAVLPEALIRGKWADYPQVTDTGIIKEVITDTKQNASDREITDLVTAMKVEFMNRLRKEVHSSPYHEIPGAKAFLKECQARTTVGIATGCWKESGEVKLGSAGYDTAGLNIASADDFDAREDILQHCQRALGQEPVVYIGDAIWDVKTTQTLGWDLIGIGEKLKGKCERWFLDYTDQDAIFAAIASLPHR